MLHDLRVIADEDHLLIVRIRPPALDHRTDRDVDPHFSRHKGQGDITVLNIVLVLGRDSAWHPKARVRIFQGVSLARKRLAAKRRDADDAMFLKLLGNVVTPVVRFPLGAAQDRAGEIHKFLHGRTPPVKSWPFASANSTNRHCRWPSAYGRDRSAKMR